MTYGTLRFITTTSSCGYDDRAEPAENMAAGIVRSKNDGIRQKFPAPTAPAAIQHHRIGGEKFFRNPQSRRVELTRRIVTACCERRSRSDPSAAKRHPLAPHTHLSVCHGDHSRMHRLQTAIPFCRFRIGRHDTALIWARSALIDTALTEDVAACAARLGSTEIPQLLASSAKKFRSDDAVGNDDLKRHDDGMFSSFSWVHVSSEQTKNEEGDEVASDWCTRER